jgi:hypothetical protein
MRQATNDTIFPNVEDCKHGNCSTHFPQFSELTEEELFRVINKVLKEEETETNSYFKRSYDNYEKLLKIYKKAAKLPFIKAAELIYSTEHSYIRYDIYFGLTGHLLIFNQCCR